MKHTLTDITMRQLVDQLREYRRTAKAFKSYKVRCDKLLAEGIAVPTDTLRVIDKEYTKAMVGINECLKQLQLD